MRTKGNILHKGECRILNILEGGFTEDLASEEEEGST